MLEKNIYSESKDLFLQELNSGNVPEDAVAYIEDTKEIWTHGTYFKTENKSLIQSICSEMIQDEMGNINTILESIINE
jgi:hypothetical protein